MPDKCDTERWETCGGAGLLLLSAMMWADKVKGAAGSRSPVSKETFENHTAALRDRFERAEEVFPNTRMGPINQEVEALSKIVAEMGKLSKANTPERNSIGIIADDLHQAISEEIVYAIMDCVCTPLKNQPGSPGAVLKELSHGR